MVDSDRLCGCGYRESLHKSDPERSTYCELAELRCKLRQAAALRVAVEAFQAAEREWEEATADASPTGAERRNAAYDAREAAKARLLEVNLG